MTGPRGVLVAQLIDVDGNAKDVTSRVLKYQGPECDFHGGLGLRTSVADLFPKDDFEEVCDRHSMLRVYDMQVGQLEISLTCRDLSRNILNRF